MSGIIQGLVASSGKGQSGSQSYLTAGTYSFTVPSGIYSITVNACGGAGGGGGADGGANYNGNGGGGGGANLKGSETISVIPYETVSITVGAGGAAVGAYARGNSGQASVVTASGGTYTADGGQFGYGYEYRGTNSPAGIGAYGANYSTNVVTYVGGTSTNGGANGGNGGASNSAGGAAGGTGKVYLSW